MSLTEIEHNILGLLIARHPKHGDWHPYTASVVPQPVADAVNNLVDSKMIYPSLSGKLQCTAKGLKAHKAGYTEPANDLLRSADTAKPDLVDWAKVGGLHVIVPAGPAHDSDCATNNAPAEPVGPCDCILNDEKVATRKALFAQIGKPIGWSKEQAEEYIKSGDTRPQTADPKIAETAESMWIELGKPVCGSKAFASICQKFDMTWQAVMKEIKQIHKEPYGFVLATETGQKIGESYQESNLPPQLISVERVRTVLHEYNKFSNADEIFLLPSHISDELFYFVTAEKQLNQFPLSIRAAFSFLNGMIALDAR